MGGDGAEHVAAVEGGRHLRPPEGRVRERVDARVGVAVQDRREDAVVGADEQVGPGRDREAAPVRPDAGVHHRDEHGPGRERRVRGGEGERGALDVAGRDLVGDVDDLRRGRDPEDRALHRPDVVVAGAEVGEEGEDRRHGRMLRP